MAQAEVVMYKKNPCPYCDRAETLFENKGVKVRIVDLTGKEDELMKIKQETGWMTVPIILINGQLVGGYSDVRALDDEGKLDSMLGI
ncbi:MAG: glutaredoxin [Bdellovibrionaceae bacterium]|nr:glutaredoxin [Pseudobdellovibrionaceae bacterium]MBX3035166.1 glutaredoxin [Pseudobdellovibrionaceae bacterium]